MFDYQNPLLSPVSKLDIKDLIDESPSPRPSTAHSSAFSQSSCLTSPHPQCSHTPSSPASGSLSHYSTGTAPPNPFGRQSVHGSQQLPQQPPPPPLSNTARAVFQQNPGLNPAAASAKRPPPSGNNTSKSPNKSRGKWTPAEDAKIIVLRGRGMKWDDISNEIPGRSTISCRLHYQNYLEKRADWDEEKRNKLARVYDRYDPYFFSKLYHWGDKTRPTRNHVDDQLTCVPDSSPNSGTPSQSSSECPGARAKPCTGPSAKQTCVVVQAYSLSPSSPTARIRLQQLHRLPARAESLSATACVDPPASSKAATSPPSPPQASAASTATATATLQLISLTPVSLPP